MNSQTDKVAELFAERDKSDSPGAALAIIKAGNIIYKRGYGSVNLDYNLPSPRNRFFTNEAGYGGGKTCADVTLEKDCKLRRNRLKFGKCS